MDTGVNASNWVQELVAFLRTQPAVSAVRIDADAHTVAVATIGNVEIEGLEEKLAETIAAIEAELAAKASARAPAGYSVRREGDTVVVGRDHCVTAETMWQWREMEWPNVREEEHAHEDEWWTLATFAAVCGVAGIAGALADHFAPGYPWLAKAL